MDIKVKDLTAYYLVAKNGGFQVRKVIIEDDVVLDDVKVDDPDAWDQSISVLEQVLSKQFA